MATISTVAVDFIANTAKFIQGLATVEKQTKRWADNTKKQTQGAQDAFNGVSSAFNNIAKSAIAIIAIQRIGAAFANAAKSAESLVDESEKVGSNVGQFAKLSLAAERNGASIDDVRTAYKELQKTINEAIAGNDDAIKSFNDLGKSFAILSEQSPDERFLQIVDALSKVEDANKRAELSNKILGRSYLNLGPLIAKGSSGFLAAGAGAATQSQIEAADRVKKAFDEVGIVLRQQVIKALAELEPLLKGIAAISKTLIENYKAVAIAIGAAFAPFVFIKVITSLAEITSQLRAITTIASVIKFGFDTKTIATALNSFTKEYGAALVSLGVKASEIFSLNTLAKAETLFARLTSSVLVLSAALAKAAGFVAILAGSFAAFSFGGETLAQKLGLTNFAAEIRENRTALADFGIELARVFGLKNFVGKTSTEILAEEAAFAAKKLEEARAAAKKRAEEQKRADAELKKQEGLLAFRNNLEAITKLPISQRLNELILLQKQFNGSLDPKKAEELAKAFASVDDELSKLAQTTRESLDPGKARIRQAEDLAAAVRRGKLTEQEARAATIKLARDEAAQYDEIIALRQKALEITSNSLLVDKEKEFRLKTLGQSYVDLIDPIGKVGRELQKVNALEGLQSITPERRKALEDYYNLQLKSSQVSLAGDEVLSANQKYLETIQQINMLLPEQSKEQDIILLRTKALKNAEAERFAAVTPFFKELVDFSQSFADGLARAVVEGQNFGDAFKNVFKSVLRDITVLILRTAILRGIMASIGFVGGIDAANAFGQVTGLTRGPGMAEGGSVMSGTAYRVGERGVETFVPSSNGYILPNDMPSGESVNVTQNIYVQTGVAQTVRAEMLQLLPRFKSEAMAGVLDAKQRGGSYAKGLSPV